MMNSPLASPKKRTFAVSGMTCRSCALIVQESLAAVAGVQQAKVHLHKNEVEVTAKGAVFPRIDHLNAALNGTQYLLSPVTASSIPSSNRRSSIYWLELCFTLAMILVGWRLLKQAGLLPSFSMSEGTIGFASIFVIGLVAASSSCLALVGGLLLSVSAKWGQSHPNASGWQKLQPLLLFNAGRLGGYFLFGGIVGLFGTAIGLSTHLTGLLTLAIAFVMIVLGLHITGILPKRYCTIPLPPTMMKRIHGLSSSENSAAAMTLGALTFFVPCGYTQSMQLLALGSGSFLTGGLIMLTFALGTLPALLGISLIGSYVRGKVAHWFLLVAGTTTLLLGIANVQSGLLLLGINPQAIVSQRLGQNPAQGAEDPYVTVDAQGRQVVSIYVSDTGYAPSSFTVDPHKPTWIYAIAPNGLSGCATTMTVPAYNLQGHIAKGSNWIGPFTPAPGKSITVTCSMGMLRADLHVRSS